MQTVLSQTELESKVSEQSLLDDPEEWLTFSREQPVSSSEGADTRTQIWESNLSFKGMYCAACALTLEQALTGVPGVLSAQVNAASHRGQVVWDAAKTKPSEWFAAVQKAGYEALPAQDVFSQERRRREGRSMLWRWAVAGFCMMQVMMYSTPEYGLFGAGVDLSDESRTLLRWASWLISLPVLVFSCTPFFKKAWQDIRAGAVSMDLPVSLGMILTFAVSTLGTFEPTGAFGKEVYFDSFTMFVFFLLTGRWLEQRLRERTAGSLEALMNRLPESVERLVAGAAGGAVSGAEAEQVFERVALRRLRVGDVLRVHPGEAFVADAVLLEGYTQVDEALLTGESKPVSKGAGEAVIAGSHNLAQAVLVRVERLGEQTQFAKIRALMERAAVDKPHWVALMDRWATPFLVFILFLAALAMVWHWQTSPSHALMIAATILIVTCPCALALAAPAALLASAGALAQRGILVQRLQGLETLAAADTFVFDKTGTLTEDGLRLNEVRLLRQELDGEALSEEQVLTQAAKLAQHSLHPIARALVQAAPLTEISLSETATKVQETAGAGLSLQTPSGELPSGEWRLGSREFCGLGIDTATPAGNLSSSSSDKVQTHLAFNGDGVASFYLDERLRSDARDALERLRTLGVQSFRILSGDGAAAVARVATELGLEGLKDFARQSGLKPQDKWAVIRALQDRGHCVAMVGDGLNDGPVLAGANVSFAFGRAVPLARAQADFLMMGEHLLDVALTRQHAQKTIRVMRQNLWWAFAYNACMVPLAFLGQVNAWQAGLGMALSSLLVVANALRLVSIDKH